MKLNDLQKALMAVEMLMTLAGVENKNLNFLKVDKLEDINPDLVSLVEFVMENMNENGPSVLTGIIMGYALLHKDTVAKESDDIRNLAGKEFRP